MNVTEFKRTPCPNPECRDGYTPRKKGMTYRTMHDGRRRPRCQQCWGAGYIEISGDVRAVENAARSNDGE